MSLLVETTVDTPKYNRIQPVERNKSVFFFLPTILPSYDTAKILFSCRIPHTHYTVTVTHDFMNTHIYMYVYTLCMLEATVCPGIRKNKKQKT